jgi:lipopolysaccharide cholinephosphotransferase
MSYIEKIRNSFPEDFFKAETRSDYYVSEKMKKLWALEIDCYREFCEICKRHDLKHYVIGGSLLGAVRHKGFIPWDDDFDVVMPREDYERFITLNLSNFNYPFFLQTPKTDSECCTSFTKFRNSESTHFPLTWKNRKVNLGAHIDIFPLDNVKPDLSDELYDEIFKLTLICSKRLKSPQSNATQTTDQYGSNTELTNLINQKGSQFRNEKTDFLGITTITIYPFSRMTWSANFFDEIIMLPFENIQITAPRSYDEVLKVLFGDYMHFPPIEECGIWHGESVYEPDIPYKQYMIENFGMQYND